MLLRAGVTVVIPVWNAVEVSEQCLMALRPTLGPADQVIVVNDGSTDSTAQLLSRESSWIEVITHQKNLGFAVACNDGAALARNELIIFLNNDTLPVGDWIASLTAPFQDPSVGAAGPMSNRISGNQLVEPRPDLPSDPVLQAHAWAEAIVEGSSGDDDWTDTARLVGFCFAVRRALFLGLGGFDSAYGQGGYEDDDLCLRILLADWRLVIAKRAFMYHSYHASFDANGLDWHEIQQRNRELYAAKFAQAFALSVLVECGNDQAALLTTLHSIEQELDGQRYEVVLLIENLGAIADVLACLDGDVQQVLINPSSSTGSAQRWQPGQLAATGLRRVAIRAGEVLTPLEAQLIMAAPIGTQLNAA